MNISNQRVRLAIDTAQMGNIFDVLTGATPQWWNGVDLQIEIGIFRGSTLITDVSNFDSITVDVKQSDPRTGLPVMSQTINSTAINQTLALSDWNAGSLAHVIAVFPNAQTNLDLTDDSVTYWLVISALTSDSPAHKIILGATPVNVVEGGDGVVPPSTVTDPLYLTAAQSDARYQRTVDLTAINTHLGTLDSEVAAVEATANAALPVAGGTMTGGLTLAGLSGVLKAAAGLVAGGATTADLPEGSPNLYWTSSRFTTALAAATGVAGGICPLDSGALIPVAFLPSITVHNTFVVASQAAMLALSAHQGDVAVRTDINQSFILTNNTPTVLGNWTELLTPTSAVTSVNGSTGAVVLTSTSIAEGTNLYYTSARAQTDALNTALTGLNVSVGGAVTSTDTILSALGRFQNRVALNDAKLTGADRVPTAGGAMTGALTFTGTANPGVIVANLTDTQRAALSPLPGMLIFNTTTSQYMIYNGAWTVLGGGTGTSWFNGSGAPASGLGVNGNYYLDTATGKVYVQTGGSWAVIYSPASVTAMPLSGGTFTGSVTFNTGLNNWGNGWNTRSNSASSFSFGAGSSSNNALVLNYTAGTGEVDLTLPNGNLNVSNGSFGIQVGGLQVLGARITNWTSPTGAQYRAGWDSSSVTLPTIAQVLCALINDLKIHGLIAT